MHSCVCMGPEFKDRSSGSKFLLLQPHAIAIIPGRAYRYSLGLYRTLDFVGLYGDLIASAELARWGYACISLWRGDVNSGSKYASVQRGLRREICHLRIVSFDPSNQLRGPATRSRMSSVRHWAQQNARTSIRISNATENTK